MFRYHPSRFYFLRSLPFRFPVSIILIEHKRLPVLRRMIGA
jgi:hypothetical protein